MSVDFSDPSTAVDMIVAIDTALSFSNRRTKAPIDEIAVNDMVVTSDATFNGGTFLTKFKGAEVDITGPNTTSSVIGGFFGNDESGNYETGGVQSTKHTGLVQGLCIGTSN